MKQKQLLLNKRMDFSYNMNCQLNMTLKLSGQGHLLRLRTVLLSLRLPVDEKGVGQGNILMSKGRLVRILF